MNDHDHDAEVYRAADDLAGVRQRATLVRKLAAKIGPITAERIARDLEELAAEVERLKANRYDAVFQPADIAIIYSDTGELIGYKYTHARD